MTENVVKNRAKLIDKTVFDSFNKLTNDSEEIRIKGALNLIVFLNKNDDNENIQKEKIYALKRLVRGVGSTSTTSRAGFFTAFVGFLSQEKGKEDCPSITEIFQIAKNELSVDGEAEGKQEAKLEVKIGKVLVCGAVIKSNLIENATDIELQTVAKTLKKGLYKKLTPLVFQFLNELIQKIDTKQFSKTLFPIFADVLRVKRDENNLNTVHFLMIASNVHKKAVNQKFFEETWESSAILDPKNHDFLAKLLLNITATITINHPFYEYFIDELIKSNQLGEFWSSIDSILALDSDSDSFKYKEVVTLRIIISLLGKLENFEVLPKILSKNFIQMVVNSVKKYDNLSEDMMGLYVELFEVLNTSYPKITDENTKMEIFKRLITNPGTVLIEKYASNKVIINLLVTMEEHSLKSAANELKLIVLNENEAELLNTERVYAANTLQKILSCKSVASNDVWREEHMKFFLNLGIFYSKDGVKVSKNKESVSGELVPTMKSLFFHCLELKSSKLKDEKKLLLNIAKHINGIVAKTGNKNLQTPLSDENLELWKKMYSHVIKPDGKSSKKLDDVFHILLMHMGLHLFKDPEVASSSIVELESVMKRVQTKAKKDEPEWIEVVVDLFLNLLSQNSSLLRSVIRHVFPHLADEISLTAFNQILSVINLKDKTNPLSSNDEEEEEGEEEEEEEKDENEEEDMKEEEEDEDSEDEEEGEEEEDEDIVDEEEEEEKVTDKMRMALHAALGNANPETDTESVDLDDMDEEEGKKLDEALAAAFKMLKKSKKSKPTKEDKKIDATLTHFRMRVFDLIDIYLKNNPNMAICLELMLYIFEMLPIAIKDTKFKSILNRYSSILNSLIKIKQFNTTKDEVTQSNLSQMLTDLMEKVAKGASFPDKNIYLLKACEFIIVCTQKIEEDGNETPSIFSQYLNEFLTHRNPVLSLNVFQSIFNMSWNGNFKLMQTLCEKGLKDNVRAIRKTQSLSLLRMFMKNKRFITKDLKKSGEHVKSLSASLLSYAKNENLNQNEFNELLQLLIEIHQFYEQNKSLSPSVSWKIFGQCIQKLRKFSLNAQTMNHYRRFCNLLKLKPILNGDLEQQNGNGVVMNGRLTTENGETDDKGVKRKKKQSSALKKEKRLKKEDRLKQASEGMENVVFANSN